MKIYRYIVIIIALVMSTAAITSAQTTEFTYQGSLKDGSASANGNYDFEFRLFAAEVGGSSLGMLSRSSVSVSDGVFSVRLDFGSLFPGADRWLEIAVRPAGAGSFQILLPRTRVDSAPYSVKSQNADNALQLGGVAANQYVITTDPRMTDSRPPTAGSGNYIQNSSSQQASSNFNITGNGTAGGKLSAQTVNASTRFEINNARVLGLGPGGNLYVGQGAGAVTTGQLNTFVGSEAGLSNTIGAANSFFGVSAGRSQDKGFSNSFFGWSAGLNQISGEANSYFGSQAGRNGTGGSRNTFIGAGAGFGNSGTDNTFVGTSAGSAQNNASGNSAFGVYSGVNISSVGNSFFGAYSGYATTAAGNNSFFGFEAGTANLGCCNAFFGSRAGKSNLDAGRNAFFGFEAGRDNTTACCNSFFGSQAGWVNTIGQSNTFIGYRAGIENISGGNNAFVGTSAGLQVTTGSGNSFLGRDAGSGVTTGHYNTYVGNETGQTNGGFREGNTAIGFQAKTANDYSTAIGARAFAESANSVVIGSIAGVNGAGTSAKVGIGTTTPSATFHVRENAGNIIMGNPCNPGFGAIGFGLFLNCTSYSILGDGGDTIINRSGGNVIQFRENNVAQITINPGGTMSINALGSGGSTQLCRNASNTISTCSSSIRYKKDISDFGSGISFVNRLRPISFAWKADGRSDVGFGAEEIATLDSRFVTYNDRGEVEGVKYDRLSVVFVNAFKEQQAEIETQKKEIGELRLQLDAMKKLVCATNREAEVCKP